MHKFEDLIDRDTKSNMNKGQNRRSSSPKVKMSIKELNQRKSVAQTSQAAPKAIMNRDSSEVYIEDSELMSHKSESKDEEREMMASICQPFKTISELNVIWARGRDGKPKEAYDGFANFCLELTYQQHIRDKENVDYRFVNFQPNKIIDLAEMIELNEKFQETKKKVERFLPTQRLKDKNQMFT